MSEAGGPRVDLRLDARAAGAIAYLTFDNRAKLNTLDRALMTEFIGKVERLAARDDLRAPVMAGAGDKAFIGGASIPEKRRSTARAPKASSRCCAGPAMPCGNYRCR